MEEELRYTKKNSILYAFYNTFLIYLFIRFICILKVIFTIFIKLIRNRTFRQGSCESRTDITTNIFTYKTEPNLLW